MECDVNFDKIWKERQSFLEKMWRERDEVLAELYTKNW